MRAGEEGSVLRQNLAVLKDIAADDSGAGTENGIPRGTPRGQKSVSKLKLSQRNWIFACPTSKLRLYCCLKFDFERVHSPRQCQHSATVPYPSEWPNRIQKGVKLLLCTRGWSPYRRRFYCRFYCHQSEKFLLSNWAVERCYRNSQPASGQF